MDDSSYPNKTIRHFQARGSAVSEQDDSAIPNRTFRGSQAGQRVAPHTGSTKISNFHTPLFAESSQSSWDLCESQSESHKSRDDRLNSSKRGIWIFLMVFAEMLPNSKTLNGSEIASIAPISTILGRNRSHRPELFFLIFASSKKFPAEKKSRRANERTKSKITQPTAAW